MKNRSHVETLQFDPFIGGASSTRLAPLRNPHSVYKAGLFLNDILWAFLAFFGCALVIFKDTELLGNTSHILTVLIFSLTAIAFFKLFTLYNYHVIYNVKKHMKSMALACLCNALIFLCAFAILFLMEKASTIQMALITVCLALLMIPLTKIVDDLSTHLLTILGLSFIMVGWIGFLGEGAALFVYDYSFVGFGFLLSVLVIGLSRYLIVHQLFSRVLRKQFRRQTVIIGDNEQARNIAEHVIKTRAPFWIAGIVGPSAEFGKTLHVAKRRLGELGQLHRIVEEHQVTEVIVTDESISKESLIAVLDYCASRRVNAWFPPGYLAVISAKLILNQFSGLEMIRLGTQKNIWLFNKIKYGFDAVATLPIFLLQLPIFLAVAAAVKLTSPGPVFYRAKVIGKSGRSFTMYKFRSMYENSDSTVHKKYVTKLIKGGLEGDDSNEKVTKMTNDDRITPVGRFIRKFSLDELPQLINVLKGDMSLVGPRPCLPYEFEAYEKWHKKRVAIRPGISGLWQVTGRSEVSFDDMILLDLYYLYNCGLLTDISILIETGFVVLKKKGAY